MKTTVSIPDDLFRQADELASRLGKTRSDVYREALADYVARRDRSTITRALDEVAGEVGAPDMQFVTVAARRTLERCEW
jgi:predicted transcriptional regulator